LLPETSYLSSKPDFRTSVIATPTHFIAMDSVVQRTQWSVANTLQGANVNNSRHADLVEQRLSTLSSMAEAASEAHAAIHASGNAPTGREIIGITEELAKLARLGACQSADQQAVRLCDWHTQLEQVLQQADRLLQWDKECVARAVRTQCAGATVTSKGNGAVLDIHASLAVVESFVAIVKSVGYQALSATAQEERHAPEKQEEEKLPPEVFYS
jgi:hypothetical protein